MDAASGAERDVDISLYVCRVAAGRNIRSKRCSRQVTRLVTDRLIDARLLSEVQGQPGGASGCHRVPFPLVSLAFLNSSSVSTPFLNVGWRNAPRTSQTCLFSIYRYNRRVLLSDTEEPFSSCFFVPGFGGARGIRFVKRVCLLG